jgi:hypothetical protein
LQVVPVVHGLPSSQLRPVRGVGALQMPVAVLQVPALKHWLGAGGQAFGSRSQRTQPAVVVPPVQAPAWQVSPVVQGLLSLQVVPSSSFSTTQKPSAPQTAFWHWSSATGKSAQSPLSEQVMQPSVLVPPPHSP